MLPTLWIDLEKLISLKTAIFQDVEKVSLHIAQWPLTVHSCGPNVQLMKRALGS